MGMAYVVFAPGKEPRATEVVRISLSTARGLDELVKVAEEQVGQFRAAAAKAEALATAITEAE
jgi:hypothetical protein